MNPRPPSNRHKAGGGRVGDSLPNVLPAEQGPGLAGRLVCVALLLSHDNTNRCQSSGKNLGKRPAAQPRIPGLGGSPRGRRLGKFARLRLGYLENVVKMLVNGFRKPYNH